VIKEPASVVGLVPAAGSARRIAPLPCSKEILPIGLRRDQHGEVRMEVASHHLLEKFARAGATRAYMILRSGKWDIPAYWLDGHLAGIDLGYLVLTESIGPPDSLDRAYPFVRHDSVVFGFPDILFGPDDVFTQLLVKLRDAKADLALGLYPVSDVRGMDMIDVDDAGRVRSMVLKPRHSDLRYGWICAAWAPAFTEFMHTFVKRERSKTGSGREAYRSVDPQGDLPMGAAIKGAIDEGLQACAILFPNDTYRDIGVPGQLATAVESSIP
jgi:glucose-1-phosphate thymidylyltransferase